MIVMMRGRVSTRKPQSLRVRLPPRKWPAAPRRPVPVVNVIRQMKLGKGAKVRRLTCCFSGHEFGLDAIELGNTSSILRVPSQQSTKTSPLLPVHVEAEDFDKLALDMVNPEDGHLLRS